MTSTLSIWSRMKGKTQGHSNAVGLNWQDGVHRHREQLNQGRAKRLETDVGLNKAQQMAWLRERIVGMTFYAVVTLCRGKCAGCVSLNMG